MVLSGPHYQAAIGEMTVWWGRSYVLVYRQHMIQQWFVLTWKCINPLLHILRSHPTRLRIPPAFCLGSSREHGVAISDLGCIKFVLLVSNIQSDDGPLVIPSFCLVGRAAGISRDAWRGTYGTDLDA